MINKILVIGELDDFIKMPKRHYSFIKGFGISTGFSKLCSVFYLTLGKDDTIDNVNLVNIDKINNNFLRTIDFILFIREFNLLEIMEKSKPIKKVLFNQNKTQKIGIKCDSLYWIFNKMYLIDFQQKYKIKWYDFLLDNFNMICVQTEEFKNQDLNKIKKKIPNRYERFNKKIFISRMGVFPEDPTFKGNNNPYEINHSYCRNDFKNLKENLALHPLCYTSINLKYSHDKGKNYNKKKTILIYMGRIRTNEGKIALMMRDIMNKLGDNFELHVFPGRFCIPNSNVSVFSSKYPVNLQILRDSIFYSCTNVIIHFPYDNHDKSKYLTYADIGIDFSSKRPLNIICPAGNAKLLEYCNYGLKVVTEKNVNNSHLVQDGKNGIVLDNIASVDEYVESIKKLVNFKYDKKFTINQTIKTNSWNIIAKEMFEHINEL